MLTLRSSLCDHRLSKFSFILLRSLVVLDIWDLIWLESWYNSTTATFHDTASALATLISRQQTATAVAHVTPGRGQVRLNGSPISLVEP